jgi:hypothetical protein
MTKEYAQKVVIANAVCCNTVLDCTTDCPLKKQCDTGQFSLDGKEIAEAVKLLNKYLEVGD